MLQDPYKEAVEVFFATEAEEQARDMTPVLIPSRTNSPTGGQDMLNGDLMQVDLLNDARQASDTTPVLVPSRPNSPTGGQDMLTEDHWLRMSRQTV